MTSRSYTNNQGAVMAYQIILTVHRNIDGSGVIIIAYPDPGVKPVVWDQEILQELMSLTAYASFGVRDDRGGGQWLYLNYANETEPQETLDVIESEREREHEIIARATRKNMRKVVFSPCSCLDAREAATPS
ncbi:hypothetical protein HY004_02810 [Candidatus Saccharibacteria bacterium]|nr:hypothetical protein [Candidatus Saccharibacteria bacterium]